MDYFIIRGKGRGKDCVFEEHNNLQELVKECKLLTTVCAHCGEQHAFDLAEFDSAEIKESIRVIDSNRDRLIGIITRLLDGTIKRQEHEALRETLKGIHQEMNDAVRMICAQNDLYGCRETLLGKGRIKIVKV